MNKKHLVVLGIAALVVALAVVAIPEAHSLAFMPPEGVMLAMTAPAVTSVRIRSLLREKAGIKDQMKAMVSVVGDRAFTPDEQVRYDRLKAQRDKLDLAVEEEVGYVRQEAGLDNPHAAGVTLIDGANGHRTLLPQLGRRLSGSYGTGHLFAEMFPTVSRSTDGFDDIGEYLRTLRSGLADPRLIQASNGAGESIGADGGFMVPTQFVSDLMDASLEDEIVRPRAMIRPMEYNSAFVSGFNTQDHSASIGGFTGVWQAEGGKFTPQKGLIRALTLNAQKLGILAAATNELLADSPFYRNELYQTIVKAIGWYLDLAFLTGNGAGQPKGVLSDQALIVVNKDAAQAANTLTWSNLAGMYERLHPASIKNACWVFNIGTRKALLGMLQPTAIAGGAAVQPTQPVLQQRSDGSFSVLGLPAFFTEKTPAFSSQGDVLLADFSQYAVGLRNEMSIAVSQHLYFDSDESAFRALIRADGRGRWSQAMQPKNGATLSWCVTLQAR